MRDLKINLTGRMRRQTTRETIEDIAAHINRRSIKDLKEFGGGNRRIRVGEYRIAT